jgi:hypothetical protein
MYSKVIVKVVHCYQMALSFGAMFIYQSLPRLLTLWLDYVDDREFEEYSTVRFSNINSLNSYISELRKNSAAFCLLTAFSQLVSRICILYNS